MDSRHDEIRVNVEGDDRLSNLPDDLIHKILSFIDIKHAINTSVLSSRWRYIWTFMPCLNFSSADFDMLPKLSEFVTHVLSCRDNQIEVSSVKLTFRGNVSQMIVKTILDYAFSHNVQQLNINCLYARMIKFPLSLFGSQSLKHLTLDGYMYDHSITTPFTWELPALATLNLYYVTLYEDEYAGLFSNCANLKNLTLKNCTVMGLNCLKIRHPGLSSLTLENGSKSVNVVTPQLKNLTIKLWRRVHLISAPNLISLYYKDFGYDYDNEHDHADDHDYFDDNEVDDDDDYDADPLQISTELSHLEKVDICIDCLFEDKAYIQKIYCLLHQLRSVKFLTLNLELVKLLSSSVELISHQPSPFANLTSLKIYPSNVTSEYSQPDVTMYTEVKNYLLDSSPSTTFTMVSHEEVTMSTEVKNYLLDGSPGATFTMVSHEEIRAVINVTLARNLMRELQVRIDQWKQNSETNTAYMKQDKAPMEIHMTTMHEQVEVENHVAQPNMKMRRHVGERLAHIKTYWEALYVQVEKGFTMTRHTISQLQLIEGVLTKVPASHQAKLQARFSNLYAEAETMMDSRMDRMRIQCNKKPRCSSVFFNERATSSHSSS